MQVEYIRPYDESNAFDPYLSRGKMYFLRRILHNFSIGGLFHDELMEDGQFMCRLQAIAASGDDAGIVTAAREIRIGGRPYLSWSFAPLFYRYRRYRRSKARFPDYVF